jgi:hypothetical protein
MVAVPQGLGGPFSGATKTVTRRHETSAPCRIQNLSTTFHLITIERIESMCPTFTLAPQLNTLIMARRLC